MDERLLAALAKVRAASERLPDGPVTPELKRIIEGLRPESTGLPAHVLELVQASCRSIEQDVWFQFHWAVLELLSRVHGEGGE